MALVMPVMCVAADAHAADADASRYRVLGPQAAASAPHHVSVDGTRGPRRALRHGPRFRARRHAPQHRARTSAGKGDVDGIALVVDYPADAPQTAQNVHVLWTDLVAASDADTARRLLRDPSFRGVARP